MRFFLDSLSQYIKAQIIALHAREPEIYIYNTTLLSTDDNRVFSGYIPADNKSYISVKQIGEIKNQYNSILYNVAINIVQKSSKNIPYRDAYYNCKGIRDSIKKNNLSIGDFTIAAGRDLSGVTPRFTEQSMYYCELIMQFMIDIATIPDEEITIS